MSEREKRVAPGGGVPVEPPPESPGPSLTSPPEAEPPLPEVREPAPDPPDPGRDLDGDVPAADTATLVAARTCSGGRLMLNVAEKRMFDLHNRARVGQGLGNLCIAPNLTKLARLRSEDMLARGYFSHDTPEGTNVLDQMKGLGYYSPSAYHTAGENLAKGGDGTDTDTPEYMFNGLMHSPGHRENILRGEFSEVGVGARSGTYQEYADVATIYTVVFGGR